jgi:hypothetical protein
MLAVDSWTHLHSWPQASPSRGKSYMAVFHMGIPWKELLRCKLKILTTCFEQPSAAKIFLGLFLYKHQCSISLRWGTFCIFFLFPLWAFRIPLAFILFLFMNCWHGVYLKKKNSHWLFPMTHSLQDYWTHILFKRINFSYALSILYMWLIRHSALMCCKEEDPVGWVPPANWNHF